MKLYIGFPTARGIYMILVGCLRELMRTGVVFPMCSMLAVDAVIAMRHRGRNRGTTTTPPPLQSKEMDMESTGLSSPLRQLGSTLPLSDATSHATPSDHLFDLSCQYEVMILRCFPLITLATNGIAGNAEWSNVEKIALSCVFFIHQTRGMSDGSISWCIGPCNAARGEGS